MVENWGLRVLDGHLYIIYFCQGSSVHPANSSGDEWGGGLWFGKAAGSFENFQPKIEQVAILCNFVYWILRLVTYIFYFVISSPIHY